MERVQFQQEQMLAELKDLVQKGLFTNKEVKQIMQKRTAFETALVRRVAKKNDYLRYVQYEMGLEALRKKRLERLKLPKTAPSVSDYALVRRQFHIFERALKKFKADVALWIQYIQLAKKEGARSLVGRISARALQLHPNVPALYILAASHELSHLSPSAARVLLQRGIRMNSESVEMWTEYVKFELGFVESMRRRWDVLGIYPSDKGKGKERAQKDVEKRMDEAEVEQMQTEADGEGDDAELARREIMQGAIVKSVMSNAAKALPKAGLFVSLHKLLSSYPTTPALRELLLQYLYDLIQQTLPTDPIALRLIASRRLTADLSGPVLVDALREANDTLRKAVEACVNGDRKEANAMAEAYAEFISEWVRKDGLDDSLKAYLLTSIHSLNHRLVKSPSKIAPPPLLSTEISLLTTQASWKTLLPFASDLLQLAARYTSSAQGRVDAKVWLARLEAIAASTSDRHSPALAEARKEARSAVQGKHVVDIWTWGLPTDEVVDEASARSVLQALEGVLNESLHMRDAPSFRLVHDSLLERCASLLKYIASPKDRLTYLRRLINAYLFDESTYKIFFEAEAESSDESSSEILQEIYHSWRRRDTLEASLAWAGWLLKQNKSREANDIIQRARLEVDGAAQLRLENGWREMVNGAGSQGQDHAESSDEEMDQD